MSELQPGMLAMVIGAENCHENIGKIFEISEIDNVDQTALIISDSVMAMNADTREKGFYGHVWARLSNLMPIKPEADPLEIKDTQELHA